ncbi:hypothetical protein WBG78_28525 [Chryseolinea sp. T2]|uniref:Abi-alpha family protein n=1 Tax=Chryseolinea sp. T2 TaxID=3129255 RepID=UPI003076E66A
MSEDNSNKSIRVDITSGAIEQGFKLANEFLSKLIMPTVEEAGLLVRDTITEWRFKKQVRILNRAHEYCAKHNIKIKPASLKVLTPLLENASLEEDEFLQDKWSILLGNMVDSENNIQNTVFPFILSQLSKDEYTKLQNELKLIDIDTNESKSRLEEVQAMLQGITKNNRLDDRFERQKLLREEQELRSHLSFNVNLLRENELQPFETANAVRLGIVQTVPIQSGYHKGLSIETNTFGTVETGGLDIEIRHEYDSYAFTDLGKRFFKVTNEKKSKSTS